MSPLPTSNSFINEDNARWFGGTMDSVWCGPHGAVMPAGIEVPTEHENIGWLGSDGITKSHNDEVAEWTGHQGGRTIRKKVTSSEDTFQFLAAETKLVVMGLLNNISEHVTKSDSTDTGVPLPEGHRDQALERQALLDHRPVGWRAGSGGYHLVPLPDSVG